MPFLPHWESGEKGIVFSSLDVMILSSWGFEPDVSASGL